MAGLGEIELDLDDPGVADTFTARLEQMRLEKSQRNSDSEDSAASIKSIPLDDIEEIFENGRRYANDVYFLPNDEAEEVRSSIMHQTYLSALSGHLTFHRVRPDINRMLDIGAGAGDWAIAMAEQYPDCEVIATDIWPFQPAGIPPNLMYEIDDARLEWDFVDRFDYVHVRGLAGAFQDWSKLYRQIYDVLEDDGVVEVGDLSLVKYEVTGKETVLEKYNTNLTQAAQLANVSFGLEHLREQLIQEAGFRVFRKVSIDIPVGMWHPDSRRSSAGKLALVTVLEGLEAQALRLLTTYLGWDPQRVTDLCEAVKEEIMTANLQPVITCQIVVGRKNPRFE